VACLTRRQFHPYLLSPIVLGVSGRVLDKPLRYFRTGQEINERADYYAIIYEFISPPVLERHVVQSQLDFFYRIGFSLESTKRDNWRGQGLLVDFSDLSALLDKYWSQANHARCDAGMILEV